MKKITKLLSVLMVMGAVGAGTAALTGCGHTHNATKVDAVPATCLTDGTKEYYTCDGEECKGKYFKDATCTTEYAEADLKVTAPGHHDFVYTDKGNGKHGKTCKQGDFTEVLEDHTYANYTDNGDGTHKVKCTVCNLDENVAHVDEKVNEGGAAGKDNLCDVCGVRFFAPGKYYNKDSSIEVEVKADGKVVHSGTEATLSEITEANTATYTINTTEYTLTKTETGYSLSWEMYGSVVTKELVPVPEAVVTQKKELAGVYTPDKLLVYSDYSGNYFKVNKFEFDIEGKLRYEVVKVDKEDGTNEEGNTYTPVTDLNDQSSAPLKYNEINLYPFTITALTSKPSTEPNTNIALTLSVKHNALEESVTFTRVEDAAIPVIPVELPLPVAGEKFADADKTHVLKNSAGYYLLDDSSIYLLKEETVGGNKEFLVSGYDSDYNKVNYKLTFVTAGEVTTIKLSAADGTDIATLSYVEIPNFVSDGVTENKAEYDDGYGIFKVEKDGWYTFTTTEDYQYDLTIYTIFEETGMPSIQGGTLNFYSALTTKAVYLTAGQKIAATADYSSAESYPFTAAYSTTEPERDWAEFTEGKFVVENFDGAEEYFVKAVAPANGTYVVSVSASTYYADKGAYFKVDNVKYGYKLEGQYEKLVYTADLTTGNEVKITLGCENQYLPLGTVTVYFETKAEYDARITKETTPPTFTAEQKATYIGSALDENWQPIEVKFVVSDSGITYQDAALTFVKSAGASFVYSYGDGATAIVTFNEDGSLNFKDDVNYLNITAYKEVPFDGFTAEQQGEYTYKGKNEMFNIEYTITLTLGEKTLSYALDTGRGATPSNLKLASLNDGVHVWRDDYDQTITFVITAAGIEVTEDNLQSMVSEYTATKGGASTGGDAETFEGFTADQQGEYTYTYNNGRGDTTVTITLSETGVHYVDSYSAPNGVDLTVTVAEGVYTCTSNFGDVASALTLTAG